MVIEIFFGALAYILIWGIYLFLFIIGLQHKCYYLQLFRNVILGPWSLSKPKIYSETKYFAELKAMRGIIMLNVHG